MNIWAVIVSALAAFVASSVYYILFAKQRAKLSPAARQSKRPPAWQMLAELARNLVLALVLAYLINHLTISSGGAAALVGLPLWLGFPVSLLIGSVLYEKVPPRLAAIHAGDWLIKLLIMCSILGNWR